jgi:holliday junction DNA helicase RuvB
MKLLKQILHSVSCKPFSSRKCSFERIMAHNDIKVIFNKALISAKPIHILLVGRPGCAKTMFLTEIMRNIKDSYLIVGSNTTKAGLVSQLFERRPKFLLIDELDKMGNPDQTSLLHLMETGIITETKVNKTRQMELISWVFATAKSDEKIIEPLLSRFVVLEVPEYTLEEFKEIAITRLGQEKIDQYIAASIAEKVWSELGSNDIRDVLKIGRLSNSIQEVPFIVAMLNKRKREGCMCRN